MYGKCKTRSGTKAEGISNALSRDGEIFGTPLHSYGVPDRLSFCALLGDTQSLMNWLILTFFFVGREEINKLPTNISC